MDGRLTASEMAMGRVETRLDGIDTRLGSLDATLGRIGGRLDRIEDKALTKWDVFQVVAYVLGAAAAAIFGPRLLAQLAAL
jgi:hypothetical protein